MTLAAALAGTVLDQARGKAAELLERAPAGRIRVAHGVLKVAEWIAPASISGTAHRPDGDLVGHVLAVGASEYRAGSVLVLAARGEVRELCPPDLDDDEDDDL